MIFNYTTIKLYWEVSNYKILKNILVQDVYRSFNLKWYYKKLWNIFVIFVENTSIFYTFPTQIPEFLRGSSCEKRKEYDARGKFENNNNSFTH